MKILLTMLVLTLAVVAGCGRSQPARYRVEGRVTCGGQPVPCGEVLFTPDGSQGNAGPQAVAEIRDGRFDTAGSRAAGTHGGPMVVRVTALKGSAGPLLAEHELLLDLPAENCRRDLDIPLPPGGTPAPGADF